MPSLDDIQELIDSLFERLEAAEGPAAVHLVTHSLRLQITRKHDRGAPLAPREQAIVDALGFMRDRSLWKRVVKGVFVLLVLVVLAAVALRYLGLV